MSELSILQAFVAAGMTPIGACAMGGNIQAESGFKSNIAQRGMTKLSDEEYTVAADAGTIGFSNDGVGYGLCQWTFPARKSGLWNFAHENGKSVGDEMTQVEFCIRELKHEYAGLWKYLCETNDLTNAVWRICTEYERPAVNNTDVRKGYANMLYMRYGDKLSNLSAPYAQGALEGIKLEGIKGALEGIKLEGIKDVGCEGEQGVCGLEAQCRGKLMPVIRRGDTSPEARYLADKLTVLGYDVLWDGLYLCIVDFQQKMGLTVDGVCGEKTWREILK